MNKSDLILDMFVSATSSNMPIRIPPRGSLKSIVSASTIVGILNYSLFYSLLESSGDLSFKKEVRKLGELFEQGVLDDTRYFRRNIT